MQCGNCWELVFPMWGVFSELLDFACPGRCHQNKIIDAAGILDALLLIYRMCSRINFDNRLGNGFSLHSYAQAVCMSG